MPNRSAGEICNSPLVLQEADYRSNPHFLLPSIGLTFYDIYKTPEPVECCHFALLCVKRARNQSCLGFTVQPASHPPCCNDCRNQSFTSVYHHRILQRCTCKSSSWAKACKLGCSLPFLVPLPSLCIFKSSFRLFWYSVFQHQCQFLSPSICPGWMTNNIGWEWAFYCWNSLCSADPFSQ